MDRQGWLRAAMLGANDGIVSTASLIAGVAAAQTDRTAILIAGTAGLVAGAMSMAAGEYISVSTQKDAENADLARERGELADDPEYELAELADIYIRRGIDPALAQEVARQLTAHDALGAHARDELNITELTAARPIQAALSSGASFASGAVLPLAVTFAAPLSAIPVTVSAASLACLGLLGAAGARAGGARMLTAAGRVMFWGALAMALTTVIGRLFGAAL